MLAVIVQRTELLVEGNISIWLSRSCITNCQVGASPGFGGTCYFRYHVHRTADGQLFINKKASEEDCDNWMAACKAQLTDWGCFPGVLWLILCIFKRRNWPKGMLPVQMLGVLLKLLTPRFLPLCHQPEGFFYSQTVLSCPLGSVCTAWLRIQGIFFPPLPSLFFPSCNSDWKAWFKGGWWLTEAIVTG